MKGSVAKVWCLVLRGADRRLGIRGVEAAGRSMAVAVSELGLFRDDFVREDFELDSLWGCGPVEVLEDRG